MGRLKITYSYDIADVPEYNFLNNPCEAAVARKEYCGSHGVVDNGVEDSATEKRQHASAAEDLHPIALNFAPEIVESSFAGKTWTETLDTFYRLHCPRFQSFEPNMEFDVIMNEVHSQFCDTVEELITQRLQEMGLNADAFGDILAKREANVPDDATVSNLAAIIRKYADFREFGQLMRGKFEELYPPTLVKQIAMPIAATTPPPPEDKIGKKVAPHSTSSLEDDSKPVLMPETMDWKVQGAKVSPLGGFGSEACCSWPTSNVKTAFGCA